MIRKDFPKDNISPRDQEGRVIGGGAYAIINFIRMILLLVTFPIRAFIYMLNPFASKNVRIKN
jgi:hypothetical protein